MTTDDKRKSKGYVYTLEVLFAIGLIFVTLVFVFRFSPPAVQGEIAIIKRSGIEAMEFLDQHRSLRQWASEYDEASIERELGTLLPASIRFETEICKAVCNAAGVPSTVNVAVVDYYLANYRDTYLDRKVRLWLWRRF